MPNIVNTAKIVYDLAKKGLTIELQEKVMQLREQALELQEENLKLKKENGELKEKIELQEKVQFKRKVYFRDGDDVPLCPKCFDSSKLLVHIHERGRKGPQKIYQCPQCEIQYGRRGEEDFTIVPLF